MTFRYALTLPASGGNKLARFNVWAAEHAPGLDYSLPPQVPIRTESLTVRLRSVNDLVRLRDACPPRLP